MTALLLYSASGALHIPIRWWSTRRATSTPPVGSGAEVREMKQSTSTRVQVPPTSLRTVTTTRSCRSWTRLGTLCGLRVSAVATTKNPSQWRSIRRATSTPLGISGMKGTSTQVQVPPTSLRSAEILMGHMICSCRSWTRLETWCGPRTSDLLVLCQKLGVKRWWSTLRTTSTSPGVSAVRLTSTQVQAPPTSPLALTILTKHSC